MGSAVRRFGLGGRGEAGATVFFCVRWEKFRIVQGCFLLVSTPYINRPLLPVFVVDGVLRFLSVFLLSFFFWVARELR